MEKEIKRLLREIIGANPNLPLIGEVVKVEGQTCSVKIDENLTVPDVRLSASINDSQNNLLIIPKKGTNVTILSLTGNLDDLCVIKIDEVEKIEYKQDGLELLIDSTDKKVQLKNDQASLHDLFGDLASILEQFKVFTPSGPSSGVLPDTMLSITNFKTKFKSLLK